MLHIFSVDIGVLEKKAQSFWGTNHLEHKFGDLHFDTEFFLQLDRYDSFSGSTDDLSKPDQFMYQVRIMTATQRSAILLFHLKLSFSYGDRCLLPLSDDADSRI